jgi:hypothetical protein
MSSLTYRYKFFFLPAVVAVTLGLVIFWIGFGTIARGDWYSGVVFLLVSLPLLLSIVWILVLGLADVCVNDDELYRKAFGVVWQRVYWKKVSHVRIFNTVDPESGRKVRSFLFITSGERIGARRIGFQERPAGMDSLIKEIFKRIEKYNIEIIDKTSGK